MWPREATSVVSRSVIAPVRRVGCRIASTHTRAHTYTLPRRELLDKPHACVTFPSRCLPSDSAIPVDTPSRISDLQRDATVDLLILRPRVNLHLITTPRSSLRPRRCPTSPGLRGSSDIARRRHDTDSLRIAASRRQDKVTINDHRRRTSSALTTLRHAICQRRTRTRGPAPETCVSCCLPDGSDQKWTGLARTRRR